MNLQPPPLSPSVVQACLTQMGRSANQARSNPAQVASYQHKLSRTGAVDLECLKCEVKLGFTNPPLSTSSQTRVEVVKANLTLNLHGTPSKGTSGEGPA